MSKHHIEFLVARDDHTWDTHVEEVDIPDGYEFVNNDERTGWLNNWALANLWTRSDFRDAAYIGVYCDDLEDDDPRITGEKT